MLAARQGNPTARLICVGHSLGAHSCGMAGKVLQKLGTAPRNLDNIIALDPAGPSFDSIALSTTSRPLAKNWRLKRSDANFVYGMHTDIKDTTAVGIASNLLGDLGHFGSPLPVGHLDVCE
jgi:hypothetical protein